MGLLRAGLMGLGDMGGEVNAVFHADSLSLHGDFFLAADAMVLLVGFGERGIFRLCSSEGYCSKWVDYFCRIGGSH